MPTAATDFIYNLRDRNASMDSQLLANRLFERIAQDQIEDLDVTLGGQFYPTGGLVFEEGSMGNYMYLILSGSVNVSKKGRGGKQEVLGQLKGGDFFGEIALLERSPRTARIAAAEPTVLCAIDEEGLMRLIMQVPGVGLNFARASMHRLKSMNTTFIDELKQSERMNLAGSMVGSIVHDFKNPMNTIKQAISFLKRKEDRTMQEVAGYLEHSVDTMLDMTQELLDFSRGKCSVSLKSIGMEELIQELDSLILNHLPERIDLDLDLAYDGKLVCDLPRLSRLFANIIKNAVEAMDGPGRLSIRSRKSEDNIRFEIEDNGCGIPPEILDQIFEPFVTHGKSGGTGLGMAIAKSVIEAHQGHIRIDSTVGLGSTFYIAIPRDLRPSG